MEAKKPFHEVVAGKLIEQLKAGTAPWQKPWESGDAYLPMNPSTGKRYKGINVVHLLAQGRSDARWMTYKQAAAVGAQVRKGEKGTTVQYWKHSEERDKLDGNGRPILDAKGQPVKETVMLERPRVFYATVFNGEQIDGLPPLQKKEQVWNAVERADQILKASGATITHVPGDRAFYRPSTDSITMPERAQFASADRYYATALHELGHWTGHSARLGRDLAHPFGSEEYAKEELRAEIASMIVGDELGIGHDPGQHAAYVGSWIKVLQDEPLEVFRAAAAAEKIHDYVLAFEQVQVREQEQDEKELDMGTEQNEISPQVLAAQQDLAAALRERGAVIEDLPEMDGEWHSISALDDKPGKQSMSYRASLEGVPHGVINNWKTGERAQWAPSGQVWELTPEKREQLKEQIRQERVSSAERKATEWEEKSKWINKEWRGLKYAPDTHGYLQRKGVENHGLKLDKHDNLVMPLEDINGKLWSVQRISADGGKLFTKGGRTGGCFCVVGDEDPKKPIVIAEGYATSCSVYETTGLPVVCALNAGNLEAVAKAFRERYPERPIFIAGDNDHVKEANGKPNVGKEKSAAAAEAVGGHVLLPNFRADDHGTDWNDLAASQGKQAVLEQISQAMRESGVDVRLAPFRETREYINVPYSERKEASQLGAGWDGKEKKWYVPPSVDAAAFSKWAREAAVTDNRKEHDTMTTTLEQRDKASDVDAKLWTPDQAKKEAESFLERLSDVDKRLEEMAQNREALYPVVHHFNAMDAARWDNESGYNALAVERFEMLDEMVRHSEANEHYRQTIEELSPSLLEEIDEEKIREDHAQEAETSADSHAADAQDRLAEEAAQQADAETQEAVDYRVNRRKEQEQREYMDGLTDMDKPDRERRDDYAVPGPVAAQSSMDMNEPSGKELKRGDYVIPPSIMRDYTEKDGKFYSKDLKNPVVMFEDKDAKLSTSTTNAKVVEDMVTLAKAKQWDSLKLSGSHEFRREAWLQAESQGIRTTGFTPKEADLVALETLRQQRTTNSIQPEHERRPTTQRQTETRFAPRHDLNKNQAEIHVSTVERRAENLEALKRNPALAGQSAEVLGKLAYLRGVLQETVKYQPKHVQDAALASFDKQAGDPASLANQEKSVGLERVQDAVDRAQPEYKQERKDSHELSL